MKVTTLDLPKNGEIDHYFIAGDWHSFHIDMPSLQIMGQHAKLFPKEKRKLIINGDFLDCDFLMKRCDMFKKFANRAEGIEEYFLEKAQAELAWGNEMLDELQKIFSEIIFVEGNHDWRYFWFRKSKYCLSAYAHNFDLKERLNLRDRNIIFVNYNDWLDIGKVSVTHGAFHGATAVKKHYEACGRSVIFSHVHKVECKSFTARDYTKMGWSLPAMCHLNPEYIKNTDNNWTNGYGTIHVKNNGNFNVHIHTIWDGELVLPNGKLLKSKAI